MIGLVIHTRLTETARFDRIKIAKKAATSICMGIGKKAQKIPTMNALATDFLFKCQREGCFKYLPSHLKEGLFLKLCSLGMYFLINLRGIVKLSRTSDLYYAHELLFSQLNSAVLDDI